MGKDKMTSKREKAGKKKNNQQPSSKTTEIGSKIKTDGQKINQESVQTTEGCNCPLTNGCIVKKSIDPVNPPTDVVELSCSNKAYGKCPYNLLIHNECCQEWETYLIKHCRASGPRYRRDNRLEHFCAFDTNHLWGQLGYWKVAQACKCLCGGFLRKIIRISQNTEKQTQQQMTSKKTKNLPSLAMAIKPSKNIGPVLLSKEKCKFSSLNQDNDGPLPGLYSDKRTADNTICPIIPHTTWKHSNRRKQTEINEIDSEHVSTEEKFFEAFVRFFDTFSGDYDELNRFINATLARTNETILTEVMSRYDTIWEWLQIHQLIWGIQLDFLAIGRRFIKENNAVYKSDDESFDKDSYQISDNENTNEELNSQFGIQTLGRRSVTPVNKLKTIDVTNRYSSVYQNNCNVSPSKASINYCSFLPQEITQVYGNYFTNSRLMLNEALAYRKCLLEIKTLAEMI